MEVGWKGSGFSESLGENLSLMGVHGDAELFSADMDSCTAFGQPFI